jgi:hypothetical protein
MSGSAAAKTKVELTGRDRAIYDSLTTPAFDTSSCFAIRPGSRWTTDLGEYEFMSGTLCFFAPVAGRPSGCWFRGKGRLLYKPSSSIERQQLRRFCGDTILDAALEEVYLRFFDSSFVLQLAACADTRLRETPPRARVVQHFGKDAIRNIRLDLAARGWAMAMNEGSSPAFLYARPELSKQRSLHFLLDDTAEEAVRVWRRPAGVSGSGIVDLVCSYDRSRPVDEAAWRTAILDGGMDILHYATEARIDGSGAMDLNVTLNCRSRRAGQVVLPFRMAPDLKADTITVGGGRAPFIYDDEGGWLLAKSSRSWMAGDSVEVRIRYHGEHLLYKFPWGDFAIRYTTRWLPVTADRHRATHQTTFQFPKYYDVVSVGERIADTVIGDDRRSTWRTLGPVSFISFNYGSFERLTDSLSGGSRIDIYRGKNHLDGLFSGDFKRKVAEEIRASIQLFSTIFCPYPWPHLAVTEIPGEHGQGFPQLLHLAWYSFDQEQKGVTDVFRAHEAAHQWFGHIVGWRSYHDQWLSEGFAEYAGALYLQARHRGNREFLHLMEQLRDRILERGGFGSWHEGPGVAPIWLGYRCASFESPASYQNLIYAKGAYILHMLRNQMCDYQSGSDDRFFAMMRDYVTTFAGMDASTDDFRRIVEKHLRMPMEWFFNQWIYGTQIPRFEYHWGRVRQTDGRWVVKGQIDQFDADPPFRVFMPVTLQFRAGQRTFVQEINSRHTEFETPPLDAEPEGVMFNDYRTVLCREKVGGRP